MGHPPSTLPSAAADTVTLLYEIAERADLQEAVKEAEHLHFRILAAICEALGFPPRANTLTELGCALGNLADDFRREGANQAKAQRRNRGGRPRDRDGEQIMRGIERAARDIRLGNTERTSERKVYQRAVDAARISVKPARQCVPTGIESIEGESLHRPCTVSPKLTQRTATYSQKERDKLADRARKRRERGVNEMLAVVELALEEHSAAIAAEA